MRAALLIVAAAACAVPTETAEHAIIGGAIDGGDPAVAYVVIAGAPCSGTLIAPRVVATAAHCAQPGVGMAAPGTVSFGNATGAFTETISIDQIWVSRYWQAGDTASDLALVRLAQPASEAPITASLGAIAAPASVRVVGFGRTVAGDPSSAGQKKTITLPVLGGALIGSAGGDTCIGDSGGAVLAEVGGGEELVAVISSGDPGCAGATYVAWLAQVPFVDEVMAAWDGPCAQDGTCDTSCAPNEVDPDCDPCGLDGTCAPDCPAIDLDCPVGPGPGADCTAATGCESRTCIAAPDDASVRYCSSACTTAADCTRPLGACEMSQCVYAGGTPGILGAACAADADCRGDLCDTRQHVCAAPCGAGDACPAGFACGPTPEGRACTLPDHGCSAGGAPGVALALCVLLRRRGRAGGCAGAGAARGRPAPAPPDPDRR